MLLVHNIMQTPEHLFHPALLIGYFQLLPIIDMTFQHLTIIVMNLKSRTSAHEIGFGSVKKKKHRILDLVTA